MIRLTSSAFENKHQIPAKYTEDGSDVSPPLAWDHVPAGTKELAIYVDDPDAPTRDPWVHWVLYKLPGDLRKLPENMPTDARLADPPGALQGPTSWTEGRTIGYRGPAPPGHATHHYHFHILAIDTVLPLAEGLDKVALLQVIEPHVLGRGMLVGTYTR